MATMTHNMTRVRGEVDALRRSREECLRSLKSDVNQMRNDLRHERFKAARKFHSEWRGFMKHLRENVSGMLSDFSDHRGAMAEKARGDRQAFMSGVRGRVVELKSQVASLRKKFAADIGDAHKAWSGSMPHHISKNSGGKTRGPKVKP